MVGEKYHLRLQNTRDNATLIVEANNLIDHMEVSGSDGQHIDD